MMIEREIPEVKPMYIPSHFQIKDVKISYRIMKEYSFATLFSQHNRMPFATHLLLLLDEENQYLYGHFASES